MKNEKLGKYLSTIGKIVAGTLGLLAIGHFIPGNGLIIWGGVFIAGCMIIIGNKLEQE